MLIALITLFAHTFCSFLQEGKVGQFATYAVKSEKHTLTITEKSDSHMSVERKTKNQKAVYRIDLKTGAIETTDDSILIDLLLCKLEILPDEKRKRIAAKAGEATRNRKLWEPPYICNGKKTSIQSRAYQTQLDGKNCTLYFGAAPFPHFIEHEDIKIRAIDLGL